jgi:CheY-like chemotaxis protein
MNHAPLILVVDDFSDNREMYAEYLRYAGFRVEEATNGREALDKAAQTMPDAIVMDLSLPEMDGWEATRRLKANPDTKHIRIIAVTGHALKGHNRSALDAGCDAFVTKPCLPEELVRHLRQLLEAPGPKARTRTGRR